MYHTERTAQNYEGVESNVMRDGRVANFHKQCLNDSHDLCLFVICMYYLNVLMSQKYSQKVPFPPKMLLNILLSTFCLCEPLLAGVGANKKPPSEAQQLVSDAGSGLQQLCRRSLFLQRRYTEAGDV